MDNQKLNNLFYAIGRALLGIYFLLPGLGKIFTYSDNLILLASKGVPFSVFSLPLTILIEISLGLFLIFGRYVRVSSIILFSLTILINIYIHDFWNLSGDIQAHEAQNFYKNMGVAAGLLILATTKKN
ncbi:MAG: DoxX family protein [SAR86 cluster bacterium]|jgi:putative oxidoreductase|nr:DoxX family protein [SAR86 cluster bacterium]|tara:strand:+ start:3621 stop:4004 length:384 start_codon:yes stop_codon:yes gene_type:complete